MQRDRSSRCAINSRNSAEEIKVDSNFSSTIEACRRKRNKPKKAGEKVQNDNDIFLGLRCKALRWWIV